LLYFYFPLLTSRSYFSFSFFCIDVHEADEWKSVLSLVITLQEDTNKTFIKKHQLVVKQQTTQWANSKAGLTSALIDMNPYFPNEYGFEPTKPTSEE
jgi:hypothetical protein